LDIQFSEAASFTPEVPAFSIETQAEESTPGIEGLQTDTLSVRTGVSGRYGWSPRIETTLTYSRLATLFDRPDLFDSVVIDTSLKLGYRWSERTRWTASYEVARTGFFDRTTDTFLQRFGAGLSQQISRGLSVEGSLGSALLEGSLTELTSEILLLKTFRSGAVTTGYSKNVGTGGGLFPTGTISHRVIARGTRSLAPKMSGYLEGTYGRTGSFPRQDRITETYQIGVGIRTELLAWLSGSLSYSYLTQRTNDTTPTTPLPAILRDPGPRNLVIFSLMATARPWRIVQ
jgi:hypothetical protein